MRRLNKVFGSRGKPLLSAVGFFVPAVLIFLVSGNATPIRAQSPPGPQPQARAATTADDAKFAEFKYDVVSIKQNKSGDNRGFGTDAIDGFSRTNTDLLGLILEAYQPLDPTYFQEMVAMIPKSLAGRRYDIQAKMDSSEVEAFRKLSPQDHLHAFQQMMRTLLADRFKMAVHFETREVPVYWLVVSKPGKLRESDGDCGAPPAKPCVIGYSGPGRYMGQNKSIARLTQSLADRLHRGVVDKTGLTGKYDIDLKWSADETEFAEGKWTIDSDEPAPDPAGPSLFAAIQEQLGLKLVPNKGQTQVLIIDHLESPSAN
jgi:uncharacterized protein (TIGR03435 family)